MNLFKKKAKEEKPKCGLKKCTDEISQIQGTFKEILDKLKKESEVEAQKNGSWLNTGTHK